MTAPPTQATEAGPEGHDDRWEPLMVWVLSRVSVVVLSVASAWTLARGTAAEVPGFTEIWYRWDADLFAKIARWGYLGYPEHYPDKGTAAFFPGQPLALRVGELVTGSLPTAGLLLSFVAGGVASVALGRVAALDHEPGVGSRAVLYLVASPFAVFLFAGYSEALFLALATTAWLAARRGRWWWAGALSCLAGTVRITGAFLALALLVMWLVDRDGHGRRWRDVPALALSFAGVAGFFVYLHSITGDWLAYQHVQATAFGRHLDAPWTSFLTTFDAARYPDQRATFAWSFGAELIALLVGVVLTVVLVVRRDWGEAVYIGAQVVTLSTSSFYASVGRATLVWWPLWILLAVAAARHRVVGAVYLGLAIPLSAAGIAAFTQGQWVG